MVERNAAATDDCPDRIGEDEVRNDLELLRRIMESVYDREDLHPKAVKIEGYDAMLVARHVERLHDDGMIDGIRSQELSSPVATVLVRDLTSAGHQFLAGMQEPTIWEKVKAGFTAKQLAAMTFSKLAELTGDVAYKVARGQMGLD